MVCVQKLNHEKVQQFKIPAITTTSNPLLLDSPN